MATAVDRHRADRPVLHVSIESPTAGKNLLELRATLGSSEPLRIDPLKPLLTSELLGA